MAGLIWLFLWAFEVDPAGAPPLPVLALFVGHPGAVVVGVVIALVQRVREIERERKTRRGLLSGGIVDKQRCPPQGRPYGCWLRPRCCCGVRQAFFPSGAASVLLAVLAAVQAAGLIPLGLALRDRLKEIKGGELYEARQY